MRDAGKGGGVKCILLVLGVCGGDFLGLVENCWKNLWTWGGKSIIITGSRVNKGPVVPVNIMR